MKGKIIELIMIFMAIGALIAFSSTPALCQDSRVDDEAIYSPEDEIDKDVRPDWGGVDFISYPSIADIFVGLTAASDSYVQYTGGRKYCSSGCTLEAGQRLPQGARIIGWELDAYDAGSGSVSLGLLRCRYYDGVCSLLATRTTTSGAPGFTSVIRSLSHTVNNYTGYYVLETQLSGGSAYGIVGALVLYRLQISPAPSIRTFNDVFPSDWYYQSVEALADSGITVGCGGGNFCPGRAVTRAEMAAFLARALGLHYPN